MKIKKTALATYLIIFFSCVWSCSNTAYLYATSEYQKAIDTFKYQLDKENVYASVFSSYSEQTAQADVDEDTVTAADDETQQQKLVYLTFDDGPSPRTAEVLDILAKYNIKATFFVISGGGEYSEYMVRAAKEGHSIGGTFRLPQI